MEDAGARMRKRGAGLLDLQAGIGLESQLPPLALDSKAPKLPLADYVSRETRYRMIEQAHAETYRELLDSAQADVASAWSHLEHLAGGGARG